MTGKYNPRWKKPNVRRRYMKRFEAEGAPCHICGGALGPIAYDQPRDSKHPLSLVIDEIIPISKAEQYGYSSKEQAALDFDNVAPAHRICNAMKGNKVGYHIRTASMQQVEQKPKRKNVIDGEW